MEIYEKMGYSLAKHTGRLRPEMKNRFIQQFVRLYIKG